MEVSVTLYQKAHVNPIHVVEKLKELELPWRDWVFEREGKFYQGFEQSAGSHSFDDETEISKEKYEYIKALEVVEKYLKKKEKK